MNQQKHYPNGHNCGSGMIYDSPEEKEICWLEREIRRLEDLNKVLVQRLVEQEAFIPKRIKLPDGKIMVWHCPDEWIPLTGLSLDPQDSQTTDNALKSKESSDSPKAGAPPLAKE